MTRQETWGERIDRYIAEGRTVSGGKLDETAKQGERNSVNFQQTLMNAFNTQFGNQQGVLNFLRGKMTDLINNPQGLSPQALAAARTNAIQQTTSNYANASTATNAAMAARGGSTLPSGVNAQIQAGLAQGAANEETGALNNITLTNEQMKQQNYWNAVSGLSGVASGYNPGGYAGAANGAGGTTAGLADAVTASESSGFANNFANSFGSTLGKTLGGGGGIAKAFGSTMGGGGGSDN